MESKNKLREEERKFLSGDYDDTEFDSHRDEQLIDEYASNNNS